MLIFCLSNSFFFLYVLDTLFSPSLTHTHTNVWTLLSALLRTQHLQGWADRLFWNYGINMETRGLSWISCEEVWTQGQGRDGLSANIFCRHTLSRVCLPTVLVHTVLTVKHAVTIKKEKHVHFSVHLCACRFFLASLLFWSDRFTHLFLVHIMAWGRCFEKPEVSLLLSKNYCTWQHFNYLETTLTFLLA